MCTILAIQMNENKTHTAQTFFKCFVQVFIIIMKKTCQTPYVIYSFPLKCRVVAMKYDYLFYTNL